MVRIQGKLANIKLVQGKLIEDQSKRRPCSALWKTPVIMWDGRLTICCFDGMMNLSIGSLKENGFKELWYGKVMDEIRLAHIRGDFIKVKTKQGFAKCAHCRGYDIPTISDEEIIYYLKSIGKQEEIEPYLKRINGKLIDIIKTDIIQTDIIQTI